MSTRQETIELARKAREHAEYADPDRAADRLSQLLASGGPEEGPDAVYGALCGLVNARGLATAAERLERSYAATLRARGVSWTAIGTALNITRQWAQQRYS